MASAGLAAGRIIEVREDMSIILRATRLGWPVRRYPEIEINCWTHPSQAAKP